MKTGEKTEETRFGAVSRNAGAAIGAISVGVSFAFARNGYDSMGLEAGASLLVILLAMRMSWPMRRRRWFWPLFVGVVVAHVYVVLSAAEVGAKPSYEHLPYMLTDLAVVMGAVWLATRLSQ
jgi:hypothetical protein